MQVLFAETREDGTPDISLSKNEVVALINALHQFSRSVFDVEVRVQRLLPFPSCTGADDQLLDTTAHARPRGPASAEAWRYVDCCWGTSQAKRAIAACVSHHGLHNRHLG